LHPGLTSSLRILRARAAPCISRAFWSAPATRAASGARLPAISDQKLVSAGLDEGFRKGVHTRGSPGFLARALGKPVMGQFDIEAALCRYWVIPQTRDHRYNTKLTQHRKARVEFV